MVKLDRGGIKIPPLACGQSAPFDKGVNPGAAKLAAKTASGHRRKPEKKPHSPTSREYGCKA
jgi:hypothetical protein